MRINISNRSGLENLKNKFGFLNPTKTVNYLISNYDLIIKENNKLSNEIMVLKLENEMLKKKNFTTKK